MRISDWSSDVCSSDLLDAGDRRDEAEISLLFVEPAAIGRGIGRALWEHAVAKARREGLRRLKVLSDPFALGFYRAVGAPLSGQIRSPVRGSDGSQRCPPVRHYQPRLRPRGVQAGPRAPIFDLKSSGGG